MYQLIINLKTYQESAGNNATTIAKAIKELEDKANEKNVRITVSPQVLDLKDFIREDITTFSQHIDDYATGAHTGYIIPQLVKDVGGTGTLINHSEHRLSLRKIKKEIERAKEVGLETCVCAENNKEAKLISKFNPDFIAVEPKELIGGDISIATAQPTLIKKSLKATNNVPLLVGAGVKSQEDVTKAIELGATGILVASGVAKATNPKKKINELLEGF